MIIAISAEDSQAFDSQVAHHFGRCPFFALVQVEGDQIAGCRMIDNPYFQTHQPGQVPEFIHQQGADVMLSGGMGRRAGDFFQQYGIQVRTGAAGTVRDSIQAFLAGDLTNGAGCSGHGGGHGDGHGHGHGEGDCHQH